MIYHNGSQDFVGLEETVEKVVASLKPHSRKYDAIIVQGVSGMCVGFPVALALDKPILVLRKQDEKCHTVPGTLVGARAIINPKKRRLLFLDDFVSTGKTRRRCVDALRTTVGARIVGTYSYGRVNSSGFDLPEGKVEWHKGGLNAN